jgi:hypothetical protein
MGVALGFQHGADPLLRKNIVKVKPCKTKSRMPRKAQDAG